jgi:hypothetical protein
MVDDEDGKRVAALQLAQKGKQRGDLAAGVLIDPVQAHEGIEDEEARMQSGNGVLQSEAIGGKIEPQRGGGDDLDIEIAQVHAGGSGDAFEPPAARSDGHPRRHRGGRGRGRAPRSGAGRGRRPPRRQPDRGPAVLANCTLATCAYCFSDVVTM